MTLHGLGGCGKSAIALEFAYRALERDASLLVFWVPAFSQESFELAYREIGSYLRIPGISNNDADIIALVKETLSSGSLSNWLMIVDNADDLSIMFGTTNGGLASAQLSDCVPYSNQGTILFTTRSKDIAEELTPDSLLGLTDLSKAEARQLLAWRVTKQALLNGETAVDELLETLTYLPLAIVQAAAFINNNHITVSEYRSLFQHPGLEAELFRERFDDPNRYQDMDNTIATTWHISFNQLRKHHPLAAKYLSFMACIDRFNIPQSLLPPGGSTLQQIKAIGSLIGYAFITERQQIDKEPGGDRFFDMHRLVHMASTGWLNDQDEWATWMATAVARLEELIPTGKIMEKKEFWATYLSHAIYVSGLDDVEHVIRGSLLDRVAHCQARLGKYPAATVTYQQALSIRSECLGPEHPDTLTTMNGFALVYCHLGHSKDSVELNKRTLALRKKVLGPEHEDTLQSMNNLAVGLKNQGKYAEAETLFKQTLERQKAQFGLQNEGTLFSMSNLAELLAIQRRFKEAETLYNDTRSEQVKLFHKKHPTVLSIDYSLAKINERTMDDRGDEAKFMFRYLLERQEEVLGPDHPDTLATVHSLAALRARLGHIAEAETMFRRVLAQREIIFGEKHLATVTTMYALAHTLRDQQIWGESAKLLDRAAQGFYTCLGGDHPTYKKCSMEHIKTQGREDSENGPSCIDEPFVLPKTEPLLLPRGPVVDYNGHAFGNQEPWAPNLPPASGASVELTTVKTSRLARSLARLGNLLPSSDVSGEPSTGKESRLARSTARLGMKKLVR
jgi:tetratricopeptide (TPR) repeat protein